MNNKIILVLVALLVVIVAVVIITKNDTADVLPTKVETKDVAPVPPSPVGVTTSYVSGSSTLEASFDTTKGTVVFMLPSIGSVTLTQAMSGSGARYLSGDGKIEFWEHQGEATVSQEGKVVFKGVVQKPADEVISAPAPQAVSVAGTWMWKSLVTHGTTTLPRKPEAFSVTFGAGGRVSGTTDCNGFSGTYTQSGAGAITLDDLVSTKMFCEGAQEDVFHMVLPTVTQYLINGDSLNLKFPDGDMYFTKKK